MTGGLLGSCCTSCCLMQPGPALPATRSRTSCDVDSRASWTPSPTPPDGPTRASKRLSRTQRSGTYLARGGKQRPPDLAFPQVRGSLALVAGEGFEPSPTTAPPSAPPRTGAYAPRPL